MNYVNQTLGEIVAADFRLASVFKESGLDFCCGGAKTLNEACLEKNIDVDLLEKSLLEVKNTPESREKSYNEWPLDFLCDYIVLTHHKYVLKTLPDLVFYANKIASVHGNNHYELYKVAELVNQINTELVQHMKAEEEILFPAIKQALKIQSANSGQIIRKEIERMHGEHEFAGGAMDKINLLTNNYRLPEDGCNTYKVTLELLQQFEDDLHIHVHLENNILFKKAILL